MLLRFAAGIDIAALICITARSCSADNRTFGGQTQQAIRLATSRLIIVHLFVGLDSVIHVLTSSFEDREAVDMRQMAQNCSKTVDGMVAIGHDATILAVWNQLPSSPSAIVATTRLVRQQVEDVSLPFVLKDARAFVQRDRDRGVERNRGIGHTKCQLEVVIRQRKRFSREVLLSALLVVFGIVLCHIP